MPNANEFEVDDLLTPYDQGRLVPFIGSGMSMPSCVSWMTLVERLEAEAGLVASPDGAKDGDLIPRAHRAASKIRLQSPQGLAEAVARSLFDNNAVPVKTRVLAENYWPVVCSTNYEDVYCRAVVSADRPPPMVIGRSARDCSRLLEQLSFPSGEVLWALQGFLGSQNAELHGHLNSRSDSLDALRSELVVGHSEYRAVTHRLPHFRRAFAHLFRTRSLLFLGSGLAEPYFLGLFDEVVELTGPPERPHYALLPEGSVDAAFLRSQYHILVRTYPSPNQDEDSTSKHDEEVSSFLESLSSRLTSGRAGVSTWGFRTDLSQRLRAGQAVPEFEVVSAALPTSADVTEEDALAVSCGRSGVQDPGEPLIGGAMRAAIGQSSERYEWVDPYVVEWENIPGVFGIVARERISDHKSKTRWFQDRRSPLAIAKAFGAFLDVAAGRSYRQVHVQLLAAGRHRVFPPWVSLTQMARAFGDWKRSNTAFPMRARVYVVDPGVRALLRAGQLDLSREIEGASLQLSLEFVDREGNRERQFLVADRRDSFGVLADRVGVTGSPIVIARPSLRLRVMERELADLREEPLEEHLISGSTLTLRFDRS